MAPPADGEVLARGPVHEAFAEPLNLQASASLVIDRAPPRPIEELPPDEQPQGNYVQWIPGYWGWDDDRRDFVWVSGIWRDCPPDQTWVPGCWNETDNGWSWTAGFWASAEVEQVDYLPEPPESQEVGPNIEQPSENHIWVPGVWRFLDARYVWRPGYWTAAQPNWMWIPAHYVSSPAGYIFVDGYWDYPIERRGVLFAPVYYREPVYTRANYFYTPSTVISTDLLTVHLFARPRYSHYYFGDYYAPQYREMGIEPWLMVPRIRGCYDPIFAYNHWNYRREGRDWGRVVGDRYDFFNRNRDYRPARTYADLRRQRFEPIRSGDKNIQNIVSQQNNLVVNFNQYVQNSERIGRGDRDRAGGMRFAKIGNDDRRAIANESRAIRSFQERRTQIQTVNPRDRDGRGSNRGGDANSRARGSLAIADLTKAETTDRRGGGRRDAANLPPRPDQAGRTVGRSSNSNDATNPTDRDTADRNVDRSRHSDRTGQFGRTGDADLNANQNPGGRGRSITGTDPNTPNSQNRDARDDRNDRVRRDTTDATRLRDNPSNAVGPSLVPPGGANRTGRTAVPTNDNENVRRSGDSFRSDRSNASGNLGNVPQSLERRDRNAEVDRRDQTDGRRTSNYPPLDSNNPSRERSSATNNNLGRERSDSRSSGTTLPGTTRTPSFDSRGSDRRNADDAQRSANPFRAGSSDANRDVNRTDARRSDANPLPGSRGTRQVTPPTGDDRSRLLPGQSSTNQLRSGSTNRSTTLGQPGRSNNPPAANTDRGTDRGSQSAQKSTRDQGRSQAAKGDSSRQSASRTSSRDTQPPPKSESRKDDNRDKRSDKEKDKDER